MVRAVAAANLEEKFVKKKKKKKFAWFDPESRASGGWYVWYVRSPMFHLPRS